MQQGLCILTRVSPRIVGGCRRIECGLSRPARTQFQTSAGRYREHKIETSYTPTTLQPTSHLHHRQVASLLQQLADCHMNPERQMVRRQTSLLHVRLVTGVTLFLITVSDTIHYNVLNAPPGTLRVLMSTLGKGDLFHLVLMFFLVTYFL